MRVRLGSMPSQSAQDEDASLYSKTTLRERLSHVTFANYTLPMSTGGIALMLHSTPHQFNGLQTIGKVIYIIDLVFFTVICAGIIFRFVDNRGSLRLSLSHPTESLFFPTLLLSAVNILSCAAAYGLPVCGPWLATALRVLFWIYHAISFIVAVAQYWILFTAKRKLTIQSMTPAWILPALSAMLTGTLASSILSSQPGDHAMPILIAGITMQGFGFSVAFIMYALYLGRLMQYGLPAPNLRPGMMIAVGPPSFTTLALIQMSNNIPEDYGYFAAHTSAAETLRVMALFIGIFLWTLAFWFFCISLISVIAGIPQMSFHLIWWGLIFPNVGFTIATGDIGQALDSPGILWVASAMAIILFCTWLYILVIEVLAIYRKDIMMPGKDEDKDEYKLDDERHNIHTFD